MKSCHRVHLDHRVMLAIRSSSKASDIHTSTEVHRVHLISAVITTKINDCD